MNHFGLGWQSNTNSRHKRKSTVCIVNPDQENLQMQYKKNIDQIREKI